MPTNIIKTASPIPATNIMEGPDFQFDNAQEIQMGAAAINQLGTQYAERKVDQALDTTNSARVQEAQSYQTQYNQALGEAMAADTKETFNQLLVEAKRIKQAQKQGIFSTTKAEAKLVKLQKDMTFLNPHLEQYISATMSSIRGNNVQLAARLDKDPVATMMEDVAAKAFEKGMTPKAYIAYNNSKAMAELREQQLDILSKTKTLATDAVIAQSALLFREQTPSEVADLARQLQAIPDKTSGSMAQAIDLHKNRVRDQRRAVLMQRYNNALRAGGEPPFNLKQALDSIDEDLVVYDRLREDMGRNMPGTLEYMESLLQFERATFEYNNDVTYHNWVWGNPAIPTSMKWAMIGDKKFFFDVQSRAITGLSVANVNKDLLFNPAFLQENADVTGIYQMLEAHPDMYPFLIGTETVDKLLGTKNAAAFYNSHSMSDQWKDYVGKNTVIEFGNLPQERKGPAALNIFSDPDIVIGNIWGAPTKGEFQNILRISEPARNVLAQKYRNELAQLMVGGAQVGDSTLTVDLNNGNPAVPFRALNPLHSGNKSRIQEAVNLANMYRELVGNEEYAKQMELLDQQLNPR